MTYDFNATLDRRNTDSEKYDLVGHSKSLDTIPMWVADMDFTAPKEVTDAIIKRAKHGAYGYSKSGESYDEAVKNWFANQYNRHIESDWIIKVPGIVFALYAAVNAFTQANDGVLIQTPVYPPFYSAITDNNRKVVKNPLVNNGGRYEIDFEDFEKKILDNNVKMFILCSPHNPVGRVWSKKELHSMASICQKHNVLIISDEIHADFIFSDADFHTLSNVAKDYEENIVSLASPSKTFNLAGLQLANVIIPSVKLRDQFNKQVEKTGYGSLNSFSFVACEAAYRYGEDWLKHLIKYLEGNMDFVCEFLEQNIPEVKLVKPEGTYLLWLDFKGLNLSQPQLEEIISEKAKLWFNDGSMFGEEGVGFQRVNIATQRSVIEEAFGRLKKALEV